MAEARRSSIEHGSDARSVSLINALPANRLQPNIRRQDKLISAIVRQNPALLLQPSQSVAPEERQQYYLGIRQNSIGNSAYLRAIQAFALPMRYEHVQNPQAALFDKLTASGDLPRHMRRIVSLVTRHNFQDSLLPNDITQFIAVLPTAIDFEASMHTAIEAVENMHKPEYRQTKKAEYLEALDELGELLYGNQWVYLKQARILEQEAATTSSHPAGALLNKTPPIDTPTPPAERALFWQTADGLLDLDNPANWAVFLQRLRDPWIFEQGVEFHPRSRIEGSVRRQYLQEQQRRFNDLADLERWKESAGKSVRLRDFIEATGASIISRFTEDLTDEREEFIRREVLVFQINTALCLFDARLTPQDSLYQRAVVLFPDATTAIKTYLASLWEGYAQQRNDSPRSVSPEDSEWIDRMRDELQPYVKQGLAAAKTLADQLGRVSPSLLGERLDIDPEKAGELYRQLENMAYTVAGVRMRNIDELKTLSLDELARLSSLTANAITDPATNEKSTVTLDQYFRRIQQAQRAIQPKAETEKPKKIVEVDIGDVLAIDGDHLDKDAPIRKKLAAISRNKLINHKFFR